MSDSQDTRAETGDGVAEIQQLRDRIKELEDQLASVAKSGREPKHTAAPNRAMSILAAALGAMAALMAGPAFITVRRWVRWWQ